MASLARENSVRSASLILIVTLTLSNVLGLARDMLLAWRFPFSVSDPYVAAFRIPDTIFNFLILGAITSAFIPIFSEIIVNEEKERGSRLVSSMLNIGALLMVISAIILYFLMPFVMPFVVSGLNSEKISDSIHLARILMLTPIFFSASYIVGGVLNSYGRFLAFSLSPLLYNLAIIFGILFVAPEFGLNGVVYCVVIGSALHLLVQLPALSQVGFKYHFTFNYHDEALKKIGRLMIPRSLSLGANQILLTIFTAIGSTISTGVISAFYYANNIQTVPTVILGNSFAAAIFPTLSRKIAEDKKDACAFYLIRAMRVIGFLLIPSTVVFILLRAQIARLIVGHGHASWGDTKMTALALAFFSISFIAQGLIPLLARAFFAIKNTKSPMIISLITVVFSVVIAYPLAHHYGISGLTLAFSLGSFLQFSLLFYMLIRIYPLIYNWSLIYSYGKTAIISLIMGGVVWLTMHLAANIVDLRYSTGVLFQTFLSVGAGIIVYLFLSYLFDAEEIKWAFSRRLNDKILENKTEQLPE